METPDTSYKTQKAWVLEQLRNGRRLSAMKAVQEANIYRLAAVIHELREQNFKIDTITCRYGRKFWAEYMLLEEPS